jgi:glutamate dehydrogenase/leucine dehydrogenase
VRGALDRIVGGKCVLRPSAGARIGEPHDAALLDFAVACLRDCDATAGIHVTTGQDLGHGTMSDGVTSSLAYMHARFEGSMLADTSRPTAEGNFHLLRGMLEAVDVPLARARVALVGAGNIGRYVLGRLRAHGAQVQALELAEETRARLAAERIAAWPVERKLEFLAQPFDAVVVNGSGGSLDAAAVAALAANPDVRVVCGSENLAMPDPAGERVLLAAGKVYAHPELGGMMGYLTAAEESLARRAGLPFDVATLLDAAERLHAVGVEATRRVVAGGYRETFQEAARRG